MSLHSSYKDFRDFQISNQFFDSLKKTPPSRLQYFFRPELDYNGYINVVRDQEEKEYKKQLHMGNLSLNRQEMRGKHQKRILAREMMEKQLAMPHCRSSSVLSQLTDGSELPDGEALHKSLTDSLNRSKSAADGEGVGIKLGAYEKWSVSRKQTLDKRAISMIEKRMQQEANELQLMEGWRSAARNSIRDKFVETRHRNTIVERHLDFLHTREKLACSPNNTMNNTMNSTMNSNNFNTSGKFSATQPEDDRERWDLDGPSPLLEHDEEVQRATASLTLPAEAAASRDQPSPTGTRLPQLRSAASSPLPDIRMSAGEIEEQQYVLDSLDEIDNFNISIGDRQVKPSQRLRSLAVDSTKSWTRPMSRS